MLNRLTVTIVIMALACITIPALADHPDPPDSWTEFPTAIEAADAGWHAQCGLSQLLIVCEDCSCGDWSVGCQTTRTYFSDRFGLFTSAPLSGATHVRFMHKTTWTEFDYMDWHLYLIMEPTPAEAAAGISAKQVIWQFDKAEEWTETCLALSEGQWQWRNADNNMWEPNHPDGTNETTTMVSLEWYTAIIFGLAIGERFMVDDLTIVTTEVAVPVSAPDQPIINAAFPNPANPAVTVEYRMAWAGSARLEIFDLAGRRVRTLVDGWQEIGRHQVRWNGRDEGGRALASGTYFVRIVTDAGVDRRAVSLVR